MLAQLIKVFANRSSVNDDEKISSTRAVTLLPSSRPNVSSVSSESSVSTSDEKVIKEPKFHGYAILCEKNKFYIGRIDADGAKTIKDRYHEHEMGVGCEWTRLYRPIKLLEKEMDQDKWDEDNMVLRYMEKYGKENVRGGSYSQIQLTRAQCFALDKKFKSINDVCFTCGSKEHFANACPDKHKQRNEFKASGNYKPASKRQSKTMASKPYARPSKSKLDTNIKSKHTTSKLVCFRCGRSTHMAYNCKNTTTVDRTKLHEYSKWEYKLKE